VRADAKLSRDLASRASIGREQHDTRTPRNSLRGRARTNPAGEKPPIDIGDAKLLSRDYHAVSG
jgi:hypothetical protein